MTKIPITEIMNETSGQVSRAEETGGEQGVQPILETNNLEKHFKESNSIIDQLRGNVRNIHAIDGVDLSFAPRSSYGVIGESGCGKSTLMKTLAGLLEPTGGEIVYKGKPFSEFKKEDWRQYRRDVQMIFQDPYNSFDPKFTVRRSVREPLDIHGIEDKEERVREVLKMVELRPPENFLDKYPSELSGGEKQRVAIARALAIDPSIIIADEPVSMLDVSTQASLLKLLSRLVKEADATLIYVSHDLSTVSYVCDVTNVMYLGRIVEQASTRKIISEPKHPYTRALTNAVPIPDPTLDREWTELEGSPSDPIDIGEGCRFRERCPDRMNICETTPLFVDSGDDSHQVSCHLHYDHEEMKTHHNGQTPSKGE